MSWHCSQGRQRSSVAEWIVDLNLFAAVVGGELFGKHDGLLGACTLSRVRDEGPLEHRADASRVISVTVVESHECLIQRELSNVVVTATRRERAWRERALLGTIRSPVWK